VEYVPWSVINVSIKRNGNYIITVRDRLCGNSASAGLTNIWITCDRLTIDEQPVVRVGGLVVAKDKFGLCPSNVGTGRSRREEVDVHRPQVSLSAQKGSDESKIRKSTFPLDCAGGYRMLFSLSKDATKDPKMSRRAISTRCFFFPRADTPRAMIPSYFS
jgi:hypothetical protein